MPGNCRAFNFMFERELTFYLNLIWAWLFGRALTTEMARQCRAFTGVLHRAKLKTPQFSVPMGAAVTNDWCIINWMCQQMSLSIFWGDPSKAARRLLPSTLTLECKRCWLDPPFLKLSHIFQMRASLWGMEKHKIYMYTHIIESGQKQIFQYSFVNDTGFQRKNAYSCWWMVFIFTITIKKYSLH